MNCSILCSSLLGIEVEEEREPGVIDGEKRRQKKDRSLCMGVSMYVRVWVSTGYRFIYRPHTLLGITSVIRSGEQVERAVGYQRQSRPYQTRDGKPNPLSFSTRPGQDRGLPGWGGVCLSV